MKITFPYWGNYSIALQSLFERLGFEVILPSKTSPFDIEQGAKISPEMYCLPFKINMGNYLRAIEKGVDSIFMWENPGLCRQRYYARLQEKILKEQGHDVSVTGFGPAFLIQLKKMSGKSIFKVIYVTLFCLKQIRLTEEIEKRARFVRPRERNIRETDKVVEDLFERLKRIKKFRHLVRFIRIIKTRFGQIPLKESSNLLKVGIIGEIFTVIDGVTNYDIEKKLGRMGVEVSRNLSISEFIKDGLFPWKMRRARKLASPYLKSGVGGHALLSVAEMVEYAKMGFDGVIHLLPMGCIPEVTVRPILHKIKEEENIPLLSISIDQHSSDTGLQTRLEAFVDMLSIKKLKICIIIWALMLAQSQPILS